jgi:nucleoside-diphosphate-sugar epimerase
MASPTSVFPYTALKGQVEEEVKKVGFEHIVIMRPGLLMGQREGNTGLGEALFQRLAKGLSLINKKHLTDPWALDVDQIAKAAVKAGSLCLEGKREGGVRLLQHKEIAALGREVVGEAS